MRIEIVVIVIVGLCVSWWKLTRVLLIVLEY